MLPNANGAVQILLAEDDRALATWMARLLRQDKQVIDCVYRGDEADAPPWQPKTTPSSCSTSVCRARPPP